MICIDFCYREEAKRGERSQQLSEWVVMRELVWVLMCPVTSHLFQRNEKGDFIVKGRVTLPSLTQVSFSLYFYIS